MTLRAAIEKLLKEARRSMSTSEIAERLNKNGWYTKRDRTPVTAFQIHRRTTSYPEIFIRSGATLSLKSPSLKVVPKGKGRNGQLKVQVVLDKEKGSPNVKKQVPNLKLQAPFNINRLRAVDGIIYPSSKKENANACVLFFDHQQSLANLSFDVTSLKTITTV